MRLQSTPKPVRFRISSGGQEHSSLESLLSCFDYNELKSLKNQLIQWLERQGSKGNEIASHLDDCDSMPSFEDTIKLFYGYDCETMIKSWCETESRNLRFINLKMIKYSQNLLSIAYRNKEVIFPKLQNSEWLEAINGCGSITNPDLLSIQSEIINEIEKEKRETEQKKIKAKKSKISSVRFKISRAGSRNNWDEITEITGIKGDKLLDMFSSGRYSPRIELNEIQIEQLTPLVDFIETNKIEHADSTMTNEIWDGNKSGQKKVKIKFSWLQTMSQNGDKITSITGVSMSRFRVDKWSHIIMLNDAKIEQLKPLVDGLEIDGKRIKG